MKLVMMKFSGRSLPVCQCIATLEFQSESNLFRISGSFYSIGFGVYETAIL